VWTLAYTRNSNNDAVRHAAVTSLAPWLKALSLASLVNRPTLTWLKLNNWDRISKSQVLSELEFILSQKERALRTNPFDAVSQNHINTLQQVCDVARLITSFINLLQ
jgi:hypothetical protein